MRALALSCCAAVLAGCSKPANRAAETSSVDDSMAAPAATSAPTVSLADFAGKWKTRASDQSGKVVGEADLVIPADSSSWSLIFPQQKPIPIRVIAVAGDSVVTEAGPYPSSQLKGAQLTNRAVNRLRDGKLVTTLETTYSVGGRDSVLHLTVEGTRAP